MLEETWLLGYTWSKDAQGISSQIDSHSQEEGW